MTQEAQEAGETQKPQEPIHERLELKLSSTVTALVDAVEDVSKERPALGVVHIEKGKATVADGFALVQVEDEGIQLEESVVLDVPFSVLKPHHKQDVTVTVSGDSAGTVSVAREIKGVTHKTETRLAATTVYPRIDHLVADVLGNTYSACVALDTSKIKRLLKLFDALGAKQIVRFYIPTNPTQPILLTMGDNIKAILMPFYADWSRDGIKKEAAEGIKYQEE